MVAALAKLKFGVYNNYLCSLHLRRISTRPSNWRSIVGYGWLSRKRSESLMPHGQWLPNGPALISGRGGEHPLAISLRRNIDTAMGWDLNALLVLFFAFPRDRRRRDFSCLLVQSRSKIGRFTLGPFLRRRDFWCRLYNLISLSLSTYRSVAKAGPSWFSRYASWRVYRNLLLREKQVIFS